MTQIAHHERMLIHRAAAQLSTSLDGLEAIVNNAAVLLGREATLEDVDIRAREKYNEILRAKCERHWASMKSYKILSFKSLILNGL